MNKKYRILVFAGGGIGDILMTIPMLRAIKKSCKDNYILVCVYGENLKFLLDRSGYTDMTINFEEPRYSGFRNKISLIAELRKHHFTHMFLNHIAERRTFFVLGYFSGIPHRIGYDRSEYAREKTYKFFLKLLTKKYKYTLGEKLRTRMNLDLLQELNIYDTNISYEPALKQDYIKTKITPTDRPLIGIHPGSQVGGELKRWDINNFIILAEILNSEFNFRTKFYIGPGEEQLAEVIGDKFEVVKNLNFSSVIQDISGCDYFISNDSGLSHLAASFGIPTLVIFGPTIKNEYELPTKYLTAEKPDLQCRPCFHLRRPCPFDHDCMKIEPKVVLKKFLELVEQFNHQKLDV